MSLIVVFLVIAGLGALGYWRGGMRLGLALLPLALASLLIWILGGAMYRFDMMRNLGFLWPGLILIVLGLGGGYALQWWLRRKLPKERATWDRVAGAVAGVFIAVIASWLVLVYATLLTATRSGAGTERQGGGSSAEMARALNSGFVRWVPGVGSISDMTMVMVELGTADEAVQARAIEILDIQALADDPYVQAVLDDPATQADIEAAANADLGALYRLQKNQRVLDLARSEAIQGALDRISLADISAAIRQAREESEGGDGRSDG